jgi:hypothetical protein
MRIPRGVRHQDQIEAYGRECRLSNFAVVVVAAKGLCPSSRSLGNWWNSPIWSISQLCETRHHFVYCVRNRFDGRNNTCKSDRDIPIAYVSMSPYDTPGWTTHRDVTSGVRSCAVIPIYIIQFLGSLFISQLTGSACQYRANGWGNSN